MGQDLSTLSPEELKKRQIREMDMEIKHKLGKGANYNSNISLSRHADDRFTSFNLLSTVKIVIRGETNTGKTCLFNRLQRKAFIEDHISTEQIQTATIPWDYKGTRGYLSIRPDDR